MQAPDLRRRFNYGLALALLALVALGLFLAAPLDELNLPPVVVTVQAQLKAAFAQLWPFAAVAALGASVGLSELTSTFEDYPREAIATRWGQYLVWLNAVAATLAFAVARVYTPPTTNVFLLILTVGVGFPTLIRTKFTVAKEFGGRAGEDLSVNVGWLYEQFQKLCKKQIDLELMTFRRRQVDRLLLRYSSVSELYDAALYVLNARATLTKEEEAAKQEELKQMIDPKVPPELARLNLGLLILELGGVAYVDSLMSVREGIPPPAMAGGAEASSEAVIKKLRDLPLDDLKQQALAALSAPEDRDKVKSLAEPIPGLPEVTQKASIASYLVDRIGAEAAQKLAEGA